MLGLVVLVLAIGGVAGSGVHDGLYVMYDAQFEYELYTDVIQFKIFTIIQHDDVISFYNFQNPTRDFRFDFNYWNETHLQYTTFTTDFWMEVCDDGLYGSGYIDTTSSGPNYGNATFYKICPSCAAGRMSSTKIGDSSSNKSTILKALWGIGGFFKMMAIPLVAYEYFSE